MSSNNSTNISTLIHSPLSSSAWTSRAVTPAVLLSLCFLVGFPGNLAVIVLKPNWQNLSRLTQSLMMNLAWSDLLCLGTLPLWIYNMLFTWTLGTVMCKIVGFLTNCSIYSSILTVTALSVQRYMQVIHQQRCLQFKKRLLVLLWLTATMLSIPALVFQTARDQHNSACRQIYTSTVQRVAVLIMELFVGFSLLAVAVCSYIFLKRKLNQTTFFNNASTSCLVNSTIVTFFLCWLPYLFFNVVSVWGILNKNQRIIDFYDLGLNLFVSVLLVNSCMNPLLYAFALGICRKNTKQRSNSTQLTPSADL